MGCSTQLFVSGELGCTCSSPRRVAFAFAKLAAVVIRMANKELGEHAKASTRRTLHFLATQDLLATQLHPCIT